MRPTIYVYVDGFNLFRRALHGTPYMWLDIAELMARALPRFQITQIRYFTARVRPSPHDLYVGRRQEAYLEALRTNPLIDIHLGQFRRDKVLMPAHPWTFDQSGNPILHKVKQNREKGSDVNLATHLMWDALHNSADAYAVLTNDSDLVTPIRMLRDSLGLDVGVVFPTAVSAKDLRDCGSWSRHVHPGMLKKSQLPDPVIAPNGTKINKPSEWV